MRVQVLSDVWDAGGGIAEVPAQFDEPVPPMHEPTFQPVTRTRILETPRGPRRVSLQLLLHTQPLPLALQRTRLDARRTVLKQNRELKSVRANFMLQLRVRVLPAGNPGASFELEPAACSAAQPLRRRFTVDDIMGGRGGVLLTPVSVRPCVYALQACMLTERTGGQAWSVQWHWRVAQRHCTPLESVQDACKATRS